MAQDFYDILQPFDYVVKLIDDNKATLGIRYIAQNDETLLPEYPAILIQTDRIRREFHATQQWLVEFHLDLWIFHAKLTVDHATRSREDIEFATAVRKLLHSDKTLGGHVIDSIVDGEFPGVYAREINAEMTGIVGTRLTWMARNRVPFSAL